MAKEYTREELEAEARKLQEEIEKLQMIIKSSDTATFEIIISDIKAEMLNNVAEENWKVLKQNKLKVEKFREIVMILQNQDELLETKQSELEDIVWKLDHFQQSLFEQKAPEEPIETGYEINSVSIVTGDIYKDRVPNANGEIIFYLIRKSEEIENSFAIISNNFDGERCLQYPSNLKLLEDTSFVGSIYGAKEEDNDVYKEVCKALEIITQSIETKEQVKG